MLRFSLWIAAVCLAAPVAGRADDTSADRPLTRIAFGSCANQDKPLPIFDKISDLRPDLLVLLGDNIYADLDKSKKVTTELIKEKYDVMAGLPAWQRLRATCPMIAIWDDHDYGKNDAGVEWPLKDESKELMLNFFGVSAESPRRKRPGAYASVMYGPAGKRVQVIMLDTRYFRTALTKADKPVPGTRILPYLPSTGPDATLLGAEQWKWLEEQLKKPADLRLIGSGIQVVSEDHPFEKWTTFPTEREKLYKMIRDTNANGVVVLSGDRHLGDLSLDAGAAVGYPLYDITSSGLNQADKNWRAPEKNAARVAAMPYGDNFGLVTIDWDQPDPVVTLQLRDVTGKLTVRHPFRLGLLKPAGATVAGKPGATTPGKPAEPLPDGAIGARDALTKVGADVTVQFEVLGAAAVSGGKRVLLNSEKDFRSDKNFTIVINAKAMTGKLEGAKPGMFTGKTVRAKGTVTEYKNSPQLQVDDPAQFEFVGK
ncbi:MAG: alkaline phosphatase D family protein [Fimbriiglobus sp.]